jgi:hypothetical protein
MRIEDKSNIEIGQAFTVLDRRPERELSAKYRGWSEQVTLEAPLRRGFWSK